MTVDWNWFFSAYAQCGAALIGIVGAFVISRLIGETERIDILRIDVMMLNAIKNDIRRRIQARRFDWHDRMIINYSYDLKTSIRDHEFNDLNDDEKLGKLFSIEPLLFGVDKCLEYLNVRIKSITPHIIGTVFPPEGIWKELEEERENICLLELEAKHLIDKLKIKSVEVKAKSGALKSIRFIIISLMLMTLGLVVYPLCYVPTSQSIEVATHEPDLSYYEDLHNRKEQLLWYLGISMMLFFGIFLVLISIRLKSLKTIEPFIEPSSLDIQNYSKYFLHSN